MSRLLFTAITSLDGYVADRDGDFSWCVPDDEVHAFVNDLERGIGTYLYGRRMYEVMVAWETLGSAAADLDVVREYAQIWRAADKVVYSRTLEAPASARTQLRREFDPDAVAELKRAAVRDLSVAGPELAAHAFSAGLVDEVRLFLAPVVVGGGTRALPEARLDLTLLDSRRFPDGTVYLRYQVGRHGTASPH